MAIDFPSAPTVGQQYTFGGVTYTFSATGVWTTGTAGLYTLAAGNMVNGKIVESHSGGQVTFALKTLSGADPSPTNPVSVALPDGSILVITAALSFFGSSNTLGVPGAGQSFRLWFAIGSNVGVPLLLCRLCTSGVAAGNNTIQGFDARGVTSTSLRGDVAQVTYAEVAAGNIPYKIVAFADYDGGLTAPGSWTVPPTRIMQVGLQTPLPGTVVQFRRMGPFAQTNNGASAAFVGTNTFITAALQSPCNGARVRMVSETYIGGSGGCYYIIHRDAYAVRSPEMQVIAPTAGTCFPITMEMFDFPNTTVAKSYQAAIRNNDGVTACYLPGSASDGQMFYEELTA